MLNVNFDERVDKCVLTGVSALAFHPNAPLMVRFANAIDAIIVRLIKRDGLCARQLLEDNTREQIAATSGFHGV